MCKICVQTVCIYRKDVRITLPHSTTRKLFSRKEKEIHTNPHIQHTTSPHIESLILHLLHRRFSAVSTPSTITTTLI